MIRRFPAIWAWCWCAAALAQPAPSDAPAKPDVAPPVPSAAEPVESADRVFVQDADGRWKAVPRSTVTDGSDSGEGQPAAVPAYIAQLQFDGEVVGDHADLTARVRVEITRADGWYEVPLALDQALIYDSKYEGTGKAAPAVPQPGASGVSWRFQGAGTHRLEIKFRLPIKASAAGRQLQLSLPQLPANYIARAVLRIPDANVQPSEPSPTVQKRVLESGMTELECDIESGRWDLAWRTEANTAPSIARVVTGVRVSADRESRLLRLFARQQCTVEQGGLTEISARLPTGFDLESVELVGTRTLITDAESDRSGWTRVQLGGGVPGEFELEWRLTRAFPSSGGAVIVDGLELAGARWQGGTIEIESVEGFGARYQVEASSALQRGDVAERRPGEAALDFRFKFLRQPFVLAYELSPVTARTDAEAETFLAINAGSNDLYVDVRLEVLSGQVHELVIDWPNYAASGWSPKFSRAEVVVNSGGAAEVVDGTLDQDALAADPHQLRLQLSRPCDGGLQTLLRFTRVAPPQAGLVELELPRPVATIRRAHALTLASAVNLETTLTTVDGEPPRVPREGPLPAGLPSQFAADGVRVYALPADPRPVTVEWTEQRRTIVAETTVSAEMLNPEAVHVEQDIAYDVSYGYVSTLLLEAPPAFRSGSLAAPVNAAGGVGFRVLLDGQELPAEARDSHWRVELPDPRRGRFQLQISHVVAAVAESGKEGAARSVTVPILQSVDAAFKSTTVRLPGASALRLAEAETGWQPWLTRSGDSAWLTATQRLGLQLVVDDTARSMPQQFTIDTAFVRTWFGDPGQITVYAEYALREAPRSVVLTLPQRAAAEFLWDGEELAVREDVRESDDGTGEYVVELPVGADETITGRLSVRYRAPRTRQLGLVSDCAVAFPRFGEKVLVDATYWEVVLPPGQQLFSPPAGLVAQYSWERETLLWVRRPTAEYQSLREQQLAVHEQDSAPGIPRGNVYAYSSVGSVAEGEFGAMAQSLIVLIGAGISLLLGFAFRRLPATRNVFSVLVLGFLCALAALWQLELIQLLLQPAVLGLLLAAIAASFDAARRDRRAYRRDAESGLPLSDRRSSAAPLPPGLPTRTAVYHPEPVSEPGRSG